jgi:hypothetical protein
MSLTSKTQGKKL